jgi:hypothetical protein
MEDTRQQVMKNLCRKCASQPIYRGGVLHCPICGPLSSINEGPFRENNPVPVENPGPMRPVVAGLIPHLHIQGIQLEKVEDEGVIEEIEA